MDKTVKLPGIVTELSGYGVGGLCSRVSEEAFLRANEEILPRRQDIGQGWCGSLNWQSGRAGYFGSLCRLEAMETPGTVCLGWNPNSQYAFDSIKRLQWALEYLKGESLSIDRQDGLPCMSISLVSGFDVCADLETEVWDIVESGEFATVLVPLINRDIQLWYENLTNRPCSHVALAALLGPSETHIQIKHPDLDGILIGGGRNPKGNSHQLTDHNTDTLAQAIDHVVSLCYLLKRCREVIVTRQRKGK